MRTMIIRIGYPCGYPILSPMFLDNVASIYPSWFSNAIGVGEPIEQAITWIDEITNLKEVLEFIHLCIDTIMDKVDCLSGRFIDTCVEFERDYVEFTFLTLGGQM